MSNNKILTVSYGTFSCTLEGFDDSFEMMKHIAEYFRDLAAEDRYFGAEPPKPDADVLTAIAQREIARHVRARNEDGRIVLTHTPDLEEEPHADPKQDPEPRPDSAPINGNPQTIEAQAPVSADQNEDVTPAVIDDPDTEFSDDATVDIADSTPVSPAHAASGSIAERLQRIRAVVARGVDEEDNEEEPAEMSALLPSSEPSPEFVQPPSTLTTPMEGSATDRVMDQPIVQPDEIEFEDPLPAHDHSDEPNANASVAQIETDARLDAVTGQTDDEQDTVESSQPIETPAPPARQEEPQDHSSIFSELEATVPGSDESDADAGENIVIPESIRDSGSNVTQPQPEADDIYTLTERVDTPAPIVSQMDGPAAPPRAPRGRIIKVKRAEVERVLEEGHVEVSPTVEAPSEPEVETSLSASDEAELMAELAAVEAEVHSDQAEVPQSDDVQTADVPLATPRSDQPVSKRELLETDVNRLMSKANEQMHEPESAMRRSAFQTLKAAVRAGRDDKKISGPQENETDDYRSDLAKVVHTRSMEPASQDGAMRPAPLRLVAEQRVDTGEPVSVAQQEDLSDDFAAEPSNFTEFCAELGIRELPDILEAAASYLTFVEGREQFSRPQLMTKVRQIEKEDFSREDGLRSFGQLLRSGKIEKVRGGRFTVTPDIGYRPDHRAAG